MKFQTLRDCQAETQFTLESLGVERSEQIAQKEHLRRFAMWLGQSDAPLTDFELVLWYAVLDAIIANENDSLTFKFKNGAEIDIDRQ